MSDAAPVTCTQCGAAIALEDLDAGLAVRVNGNLVCGMCVDTLPGEAVLRINRMRALRGLEVTTYKVTRSKAPNLQLYSFTTSANMAMHLRKLTTDGFFEAPPLPPPGQRVALPSEPSRKTTDRVAPWVKPSRRSMLLAAGGTVAALIVVAVLILMMSGPTTSPTTESTAGVDSTTAPKPKVAEKTRLDYAVDPAIAWQETQNDRDCPLHIKQDIEQEYIRVLKQPLEQAEAELDDRRIDEAESLLQGWRAPDDIIFGAVRSQHYALKKRIESARALAQTLPKPQPPARRPVDPVPTTSTVPTEPVAETNPLPIPTPETPTTDTTVVAITPDTKTPTNTTTPASQPENPEPIITQPQVPSVELTFAITTWSGSFLTTSRDKKPYELSWNNGEYIPDGWPAGTSTFYRSSKAASLKHHVIVMDLQKADVSGGGIAVLIHPMRLDRQQMDFSVTDASGKTVSKSTVTFKENTWTPVFFDLSTAENFKAGEVISCMLQDTKAGNDIPEDSGFLLAKTVLIKGRPPTLADLGIGPSPLLSDDNRVRHFPRTLEQVAKNRRRSSSKKMFEPDRITFAVSSALTDDQATRANIERLLSGSFAVKNPQENILSLTMEQSWLDAMTKGRNAPMTISQMQIIVLWTVGQELQAVQDQSSAASDFWRVRIEQLLDAGFLPVVVLGPTPAAGLDVGAVQACWNAVPTLPIIQSSSVPIIDLRPFAESERMTALTTGLQEVMYLLDRFGVFK